MDDTALPSQESDVNVVFNLESLIKQHISSITRLEEELSKYKDMLDDIFTNDTTYKKHDENVKEAVKIRTATKQQIMKQPQAADLAEKVKSFRSQIKENKEALSDYLREFQRLSGISEIEGEDGELREIIYTAKLVKKSFGR